MGLHEIHFLYQIGSLGLCYLKFLDFGELIQKDSFADALFSILQIDLIKICINFELRVKELLMFYTNDYPNFFSCIAYDVLYVRKYFNWVSSFNSISSASVIEAVNRIYFSLILKSERQFFPLNVDFEKARLYI